MPTTDATVVREIESFLFKHGIPSDAGIAVAFSGGCDSLALLVALKAIHPKRPLLALYVNHQLRDDEELKQELLLNKANCEALAVALRVLDLGKDRVAGLASRKGGGIEDAARTLRYEALSEACRNAGFRYLATAHHADDQLETVLMHLFHASSVISMQGIQPVRRISDELSLIRPAISLEHSCLEQYLRTKGLCWSEDSSNKEHSFLRNAIRHTLVPQIRTLFPEPYQAVQRMSDRFSLVGRLLEDLVAGAMGNVNFHDDTMTFPLEQFQALHPSVAELFLYQLALRFEGEKRISHGLIGRLISALSSSTQTSRWVIESTNMRISLSKSYVVWKRIEQVWNFCLPLERPSDAQILDVGNQVEFSIQDEDPTIDATLLRIDATMLDEPVLRSAADSDVIALEAGVVNVKKLLAHYKIDRAKHPAVPVLADRSGVVAVFARPFGGRDRLAKRFKAPLARRLTNIYSSNKRNDCSEIEKR